MRKIFAIVIIIVNGLFCSGYATAQQKQSSSLLVITAQNNPNLKERNIVNNYTFTDSTGKPVKLSDFRGKWLMVDVWYSGCGACITANAAMRTVHDSLAKEGIVFMSISVDKNREKWLASITPGALKSKMNPWAGKYVPAKGTITLYTSGSGHDNDFRRIFVPNDLYPTLLLFDKEGSLIKDNPPRPDVNPNDLINFIRSKRRLSEDF